MKRSRLTAMVPAATSASMKVAGTKNGQSGWREGIARCSAAAMVVMGATGLSGCISVNAPDKPIVIELNINIKQEVIYRLAEDASKTIESNADIF